MPVERPAVPPPLAPERVSAREKLLAAARDVIRTRGFAATSVDELCRAAGVTKGAFFHHFESKEALGKAAAEYWAETTSALFAAAPYHAPEDPLDRIFAYLDFRRELLAGDLAEFTCLVGTMAQEVYATSPAIRDACAASIFAHAETLEPDLQAAIAAHAPGSGVSAASLARHTQAVLQGAFILAKATGDAEAGRALVAEAIEHLKRYVAFLFSTPAPKKRSA